MGLVGWVLVVVWVGPWWRGKHLKKYDLTEAVLRCKLAGRVLKGIE